MTHSQVPNSELFAPLPLISIRICAATRRVLVALMAGMAIASSSHSLAVSPVESQKETLKRLGPLEPRLTDLVASLLSGFVVVTYNERFRYSDFLSDEDWKIVVGKLLRISQTVREHLRASGVFKELELQSIAYGELQKLSHDELSSLNRFLDSDAGKLWLEANSKFEREYFQASVVSSAHVIASTTRMEKIARLAQGSPFTARTYENPFLIARVVRSQGSNAGSTIVILGVLGSVPLLGGQQISEAHEDAQRALSRARNEGIGPNAIETMARVVSLTLERARKSFNSAQFLNSLAGDLNKEIDMLARRADGVASARLLKRCPGEFDQESIAASNGILEKILVRGRPVTPGVSGNLSTDLLPVRRGAPEHAWLGENYERGCFGRKDFENALRIYMEFADATQDGRYTCKVSQWIRMGIGGNADSRLADHWLMKLGTHASVCKTELEIDPRDVWKGMR